MNTPRTNPYIGPRTFMKEEGHLFFGRDREARDLISLVVAHRLVLFYAQSGAGKSSIINTRLISNLEEERGFEVFPVGRVSGDLAPEGVESNVYTYNLMRSLIQHEVDAQVLAGLSLSQFLAHLNSDEKGYFYDPPLLHDRDYPEWRHALIIDQFEELFSTHPEAWKKREDFFCQLADAMQDDPYLWVILVMREDFIASLDPYAHLLPDGLKVRYYMQRLGREAALKAIKNPVAQMRPFAPNVAEKLVDDLCSIKVQNPDGSQGTQPGQYVEPVQLQVVCYSLWENLEDGTEITEDDVRKVGDVDKALGTYYAGRVKSVAAIEKLNVTEGAIRRWFETGLITEGGIRNMVLREPNKKSGGLLDDDVIQALQSDLVRAEKRSGATWYELTHDRLVEPILADNKTWFEQNSSVLQRQAKLWNDQARNVNLLLRDQALEEALQWAREHDDELRTYERDFLKASQEWQDQLKKRQQFERMELEQAAAEARAELQAKAALRARRLTRLAFSLLGLALIAVGFAVSQSIAAIRNADLLAIKEAEANASADRAKELANAAVARELAGQAADNLDKQLDLALLLGMEAYNKNLEYPEAALIPQVESIMFDSVQRSQRMRGYLATSQNPALQFEYSPDGEHIAILQHDGIALWDVSQNMASQTIPGTSLVNQFFFSPDSSKLVYLDPQGVAFWDVQNSRALNASSLNGHQGAVIEIAFSADGSSFATVGENGDFTLWSSNQRSSIFESPSVKTHAFGPDGRQFAILERDGHIAIHGMSDGRLQGESIEVEPETVTAMAFSESGDTLAYGDKNGNIVLWDIANQRQIKSFSHHSLSGEVQAIQSISFASSDSYLVYQSLDGLVTWSLEEDKQSDETIPVTGNLIYNPNGKVFAEQFGSGQIFLRDIPEGMARAPISGTLGVFSADGTMLAVFDEGDNSLRLINVSNGEQLGAAFPEQLDIPVNMAFSQDADLLAIATADGSIQVWDVPDRSLRFQNRTEKSLPSVLTFNPKGNLLVVGYQNGSLSLWQEEENKTQRIETGYEGYINYIGLSPTGSYVYTVARDGIVLIDSKIMQNIGGVFPGSTAVFSPGENFLVTIGASMPGGGCTLWSLPSGRKIKGGIECSEVQFSPTEDRVLATHATEGSSYVTALLDTSSGRPVGASATGYPLAFSPDGKWVAINDWNVGEITILNTSTGRPVGLSVPANSAYFSSQGDTVALTDFNGNLVFMNLSTDEVLGELSATSFIGFSPDGKVFISQDYYGGSISFHRVDNLELIGDPVLGVFSITMSPDQQRIAIMTYSGISLWETATGKRVEDLPGFGTASNLQFSPDGDRAVSFDYYSSTSLWTFPKGTKPAKVDLGNAQTFQAFSPQGNFILMKDNLTQAFTFWDTATGKQVGGALAGHAGPILGGVLNASGRVHAFFESNFVGYNNASYMIGDVQTGSSFLLSPNEETYSVFNPADGSVSLWNAEASGSIPGHEIAPSQEDVQNAVLSPDGHTLAVSMQQGMKLLDLQTNVEIGKLSNIYVKQPSSVYLSPNGKSMAIVYGDNSLSLWNVEEVVQIGESINEAFYAFSPDGQRFITSTAYQAYSLWDSTTGRKIGQTLTGGDMIHFSRDGKYIVIPSYYGGAIRIFDASTGTEFGEVPQGSLLGMGPGDHSIVTSDPASAVLIGISTEMDALSFIPNDGTTYFYLSPDGRYLAGVGSGPTVLWDLETHQQIGQITGVTGDFRGFSPQGEIVSFFSYDEGGFVLFQTKYPNARILDEAILGDYLIFSPDDKLVVPSYYYGSGNSIPTLYNTVTHEKLGEGVKGYFRGFADGGKLMITVSDEEHVYVWSTDDFTEPVETVEYQGIYLGTALIEDGSTLALYGNQGVTLLDLASPTRSSKQIKETTGLVEQIVFSPNGKIMATVASDGLVLWDVESRSPLGETITSSAVIKRVSFSLDSRFMVYLDAQGNAFMIDLGGVSGVNHPRKLSLPSNTCAVALDAENHLLIVEQAVQQLQILNMDTDVVTELKDGSCNDPIAFSQDGRSFAFVKENRTYVFTPDPVQGSPFAQLTEIVGDQDSYSSLEFVVDGSIVSMQGANNRIQ
ncbi:MAG: WD40 repeat domain-containing protein, partial [Chloroflexota bacterium]